MNKKELIQTIAEITGDSQTKTGEVLDATLKVIQDELANGGHVAIQGFGRFETRDRKARKGTNPQTGKSIDIPATTVPAFRAGKTLKDAVKPQ